MNKEIEELKNKINNLEPDDEIKDQKIKLIDEMKYKNNLEAKEI